MSKLEDEEGAAGRLLIVDDNPVNLSVVVEHLEESGYEVLVALDGQEALKRAAYSRPDLILLDVMMPGIDGFETCRRLKQQMATAEIPVIFMTALDDIADKVAAFQAGGVDYVSKPFQPEELLARVRTHLTLRRAQLSLAAQNERLQAEVAARREAETALRASEQSFRRLFETADDGIALLDPELGTIVDANTRLQHVVHRSRVELIGRRFDDLPTFALVDDHRAAADELRRIGLFKSDEWTLKRPDGTAVAVEVTATACEAGGRKLAQWNFRDISDRKEAEARIRYLALHDPLTGLANRTKFFDRLQQSIAAARRNSARVAALAIDLDHFKAVNDTHGHAAGDVVIQAIGTALNGALRATDKIARFGGEEFIVLIHEVDESGIITVAQNLRRTVEALAIPYQDRTLSVTVSVGGALAGPDDRDIQDVIERADDALYKAKAAGRNRVTIDGLQIQLASAVA